MAIGLWLFAVGLDFAVEALTNFFSSLLFSPNTYWDE
jgi:hypothetical protein